MEVIRKNILADIRRQFPILRQEINGKPLVYLDNGATTQKPQSVIAAINRYYQMDNSNVHRGVHALSQRATEQYEFARETIKEFINARSSNEIIFTRGATESINLVAQSFVKSRLTAGDEIIITEMEHHSNIVPWQMISDEVGALLKVLPVTDDGELAINKLPELITRRTKFMALTHVSNVLGTINPVKEIIKLAHQHGIVVLLDGAQAAAHIPIDVQELDVDFYALSAHKIYGPTGIGALYGKHELLEAMQPYQGGGSMISQVSFKKTTYAPSPQKFEAGTPNIAGAIGFAAAINFFRQFTLSEIMRHEQQLYQYAVNQLKKIDQLTIIGTSPKKIGVISFIIDDIHPHDIATILDADGIAVRAGHHCAMPLMERYQLPATVRASLAIYNNEADIDAFVRGMTKVREIFQ